MPPIYFYLPKRDWPQPPRALPSNPDEYWFDFTRGLTSGVYAWTIQTFLQLRRDGVACELVSEMPGRGIVFAHRRSLASAFRPGRELLLVCLKADYDRHPFAQFHVVLNPRETRMIRNSAHIPHWPQPGLIPRDPARGDRFECVAFFGEEKNLAPELRSAEWRGALAAMKLAWTIVPKEHWNDFSGVDAVVAARGFEDKGWSWKPAQKLYNAWHAGVPAILGRELAFGAERRSVLDFFTADSMQDALDALRKLAADPGLCRAMIENGRARANETAPAKIVEKWRGLIESALVPAFHRWCATPSWRQRVSLDLRAATFALHAWKLRVRGLLKPA